MTATRSSRRRVIGWIAVALLCSLTVLAGTAPTANTKLLPFTALLTGGQEVPPNESTAFGVAFFTLDTKTDILSYSISYDALGTAVTLAHIHGPATPFQDAPPMIDLAITNPINGASAALTKEQLSALKKGLMYVNIHSEQFPGGEIRGQLLPTKTSYKFEVPVGDG